MQRYFIELAYNGTEYFGWQRQPNDISVQQVVEEALSKLNSNKEVKVVGCGRTDTGVHAHQFILHVDLPSIEHPEKYMYKLNSMLPESIAIFKIKEVEHEAHARFHATSRTYRYFIHRMKNPFKQDQSWHLIQALDVEKMNEAAKLMIGSKDFTSFSKVNTDTKTNICVVTKAEWIVESDTEIYFEITADRFLRNMVRATVGTLVDVGVGKLEPADISAILEAKDRGEASTSVPAHGLFLWKVDY
ncbi:MAG: tRNA pseudouridine(38-40) synthase TruA [Crocinitomicaceae bacterium]|nr:tRNA pseudouridine(38-40) synthase TruA [Crocinitomicaceae bacterium]